MLGAGTEEYLCINPADGQALSLDRAVALLAHHDVVFLGEQHDNDVGHRAQLDLTRGLLEHHGDLAISLEMFERDVQHLLDAYLAGDLSEEAFLVDARPWGNYAEHYRPAIELARERGLVVLAANVPRPLAARVAREGLMRVLPQPHTPRIALAPPGEYRERFNAVMSTHGGVDGFVSDNVFASQCIKDDAMAESIADALARPDAPVVVHWCGRFHSDYGLGTVERLSWRRPDLRIAVVTMSPMEDLAAPLSDDERARADLVLRVPLQPAEE